MNQRYEFDHVIVTLPLGVLKEDKVKFEPPLLRYKLDAIKNIGFGISEKIASYVTFLPPIRH